MKKFGTLFLSAIMCIGLLSSCTSIGAPDFNNNNNNNKDDQKTCQHEKTTQLTKQATCEESGYMEEICSECGERIKLETIEPLGHNYIVSYEVKATCTENGYQEMTCTRCNKSYNIPLEATGHSYDSNGICKKCGKSNGSVSANKQQVINHLMSKGSGEYYYVTTNSNKTTALGYEKENDFFMTSSYLKTDNYTSSLVTGSEFGDSSNIYVLYYLTSPDEKETYVEAECYVYCSNHVFDGVVNNEIKANKCIFTSEEDLKELADLIVEQTKMTLNNASNYLKINNLPYIY